MDECNRIDDIIDEVRRLNKDMFSGTAAEPAAEDEGSEWSLEDIDRLIAGESVSHEKLAQIGQDDFKTDEVIPGVATAEIEQPDFDEAFSFEEELKKIENDISNELPPEITDGMFTDKPLHLFKDSEESDDIFSGEQPELDGQETLYNTEEADFNISDFNLETVIMPEQEPLRPSKYPGVKAIVDTLYENKNTASEYFEKSRRSITAVDDAPVSPDDYKTRFFAKPVVSSSEDIDVISLSPVDRSGIVVARSKSSDEGGLEPMPTVLSAEEALKRGSDAVFPETVSENVDSNDVDSQIMFSGFETVDEESMPVNANAAEIESDLEDKRRKRIEKFRLKTPDDETGSALDALDYQPPVKKQKRDKAAVIANEADSETNNPAGNKDEYTDPSQRESIRRMLAERSKKSLSRVIGIAAIEVLLFIISLIPPLFEKLSI
nr:hypothetical protein [Clostridiales bacterium]